MSAEADNRKKNRKPHDLPWKDVLSHEKKTKRKHRPSSNESTSPNSDSHPRENGTSAERKHQTSESSLKTSPFYQERVSLYLPIAPISQTQPIEALCAEHLSPLILTYYPPLHGVILTYSNAQCHSSLAEASNGQNIPIAYAKAIDEYGSSFIWLTVDFVIFRPQKGDRLDGYINLQNENGLGVVSWNYFNATIKRDHLPTTWRWMAGGSKIRSKKLQKPDEISTTLLKEPLDGSKVVFQEDTQGHFRDSKKRKVQGSLDFSVRHIETARSIDPENAFLGIEGSDVKLREAEETAGETSKAKSMRIKDTIEATDAGAVSAEGEE